MPLPIVWKLLSSHWVFALGAPLIGEHSERRFINVVCRPTDMYRYDTIQRDRTEQLLCNWAAICYLFTAADRNVFLYRSSEDELLEFDIDQNLTQLVLSNSTFVSTQLFACLSVLMSVGIYMYVFICLSLLVCPCLSDFICLSLSVCLLPRVFVCLALSVIVCLSLSVSACLCLSIFVCASFCFSIYLSVSLCEEGFDGGWIACRESWTQMSTFLLPITTTFFSPTTSKRSVHLDSQNIVHVNDQISYKTVAT